MTKFTRWLLTIFLLLLAALMIAVLIQEENRPKPGPNFRAHMNLGSFYDRAGKYKLAEHHYLIALTAPIFANVNEKSRCWHNLGQIYSNVNKFTMGIICFKEALKLDPGEAKTMVSLAGLLARQERFELAERWLVASLRIEPNRKVAKELLMKLRKRRKK